MSRLFDELERERASGRTYTLRDWLQEHPPPPDAFTQTVAGIARRALAGEDLFVAVRELLDEFPLRPGAELRATALREPPPPTGDTRHDAYVAALAEHLAVIHGLERPAWVCEEQRFLDRFWFPSEVAGFRALAIATSPAAFRRRGIFIAASSLERV